MPASKRIGVIGLGQRIAHVLAAMKEVGWALNIAGYADPSPVGAPILKDHDIPAGRQYEDAQALLKDGPFDLVMIGSPNHLHYEHLLAAFAAGHPIFAEKPIVRTEEESFALARHLADTKTPPLYIGLVMRSMPIVRAVIAHVMKGGSAASYRWMPPNIFIPNMAAISRATGGANRSGAAPISSTRSATISISSTG